MMKKRQYYLVWFLTALMSVSAISCSDKELGATIFDTNDYPLDRSLYSFPLDTFIKKNYLEPYNLRFVYKMEDIASDLQKNLVPAEYEKSVELAVLTKYLWFDVYKKLGGEEFLRENSPRIIHVIGSPAYNPTSGTQEQGLTEGGLKVTLYNTNNLDVNNVTTLNTLFFHVMHHEFGHILDQTHQHPNEFNLLSNGQYDPLDWGNSSDSITASHGFVTPYASSLTSEDWVETLASYVCDDSIKWNNLLNTASYAWEEVDMTEDDYSKLIRPRCNYDTIGYIRNLPNGDIKVVRKVVTRNGDGTVLLDAEGNFEFVPPVGINGKELILQKVQYVREWLQNFFGINLDELRSEVQYRQYLTGSDGKFLLDEQNQFVNRLTAPAAGSQQRTLMDTLLDEVNEYKKLQ